MQTNFIILSRSVVALCFGVVIMQVANANTINLSEAVLKDLIPEQQGMAILAPEPRHQPLLRSGEEALKVKAWVDRKNATYRLGETVRFSIKTNKDAYITLFDVGTTGTAHVIFPNEFQRTNFVHAGETVRIPQVGASFQLKVAGKTGTELIKVIASSKRETLIEDKYLASTGPFKVVTKNIEVLSADIKQRFNQTEAETEWSVYEKVLYIR